MKTIAQQLNIKKFPFIIKDADGKLIYWETSDGYWEKREFAGGKEIHYETSRGFWAKWEYGEGKEIYCEDSTGFIEDNRPKTDIQKAIDLLTKEGLIVNGQILETKL